MGNNATLTLIKQSPSQYVIVGDIINYTITASNFSSLPFNNITINDLLPPQLEFVDGSVSINTNPQPTSNILLGVNIGPLAPGKSTSLSFNAKVLSAGTGTIPNTANADFYYSLPGSTTPLLGSAVSNTLGVNSYIADLSLIKSTDVTSVNIKDYINYTITLKNQGNLDASNVIFTDSLPNAVKLVDGSFSINGFVVNNVNIATGINIGNIPVGGTTTIKYKVQVLGTVCTGNIVNSASASFNYMLPDGSSGVKIISSTSSSTVAVKVSPSSFRQISMDDYLQIPCQKPDIETINSATGKIEILNSHVIQTQNSASSEGQLLSGYKLIVHGILREVIEYTANETTQSVHSAHYNIPFSNFIVLPPNYVIGSKLEIEGIVEGISATAVDGRCFYNNATILLLAKVLSC